MMPSTARKLRSKASKKQIVTAAAKKHHVPPWLLWGIFGAESTWGTNGNNYFGLIMPTYTMYDGTTRSPRNTADLAESADIAAELLYSLKKESGSWAGAVNQYAPYDINHPRELSRQGKDEANTMVSLGPSDVLPYVSPLYRLFNGEAPLPKFPGQNLLPGGGGGESLLDNPGGIGEITSFFAHASKLLFTPEGWLQIGEVTGGIILIGWGLHRIVNSSTGVNPTRSVTKTAAKAAEVAAIVK